MMQLELDDIVCPIGHHFRGTLTRQPDADGLSSTSKARSVRLVLRMYTEGRGDTDRSEIAGLNFDLQSHGGLSVPFALAVPEGSPISYDGTLIRIKYEIEAKVDLKLARDEKFARQVLVVPEGGMGVYDRPHPLPRLAS